MITIRLAETSLRAGDGENRKHKGEHDMWPTKWFTIVWEDKDGNVQTSCHYFGMNGSDACRHVPKHSKILKIIEEYV